MSKSKPINNESASEDENNVTEESETSDDEYYLSDFTKLQPYMREPCVAKESMEENCPGKELSGLEEDTSRIKKNL